VSERVSERKNGRRDGTRERERGSGSTNVVRMRQRVLTKRLNPSDQKRLETTTRD
jgi:hypothetical protein